MFRSTVLILGVAGACLAGVTKREAEPGYGKHNNLQCFSKPHKQCHQRPVQNQRQVCHEEYDTIVDTTYIEECQDIVTKHCQETKKQVHHSSAVVGYDSKVIAGGYGGYGKYGKREAEAEADAGAPGYGYSSGPKCQQHVEKKCQKVPKQNARKVVRPVCQKIAKPVCQKVAIKVPYEVCGQSYVARSQVSKGYGYY